MDILPEKKELIDGKLGNNEIKSILYDKLKDFEKTLKDKELCIYQNRLLTENPATLQEIGDKYGITRERTRQIEEKLLKKIKDFLKEEIPGIEDYQITIDG